MTAVLGNGIREGVVETLRNGYGFIRPDGGGDAIFFHASDEWRVVDLSGRLDFSGRGSVPGVVPTLGARIIYRVIDDRGRPKAAPWGLVPTGESDAPSNEPNYATDSIASLIARKSGDNMGAMSLVQDVVRQMHELEFRAFCAITPDGVGLWDAFKDWRRAQETDDVEFIGYVRAEFARNQPKMVGPRRCIQPAEVRAGIWRIGFDHRGLRPNTHELVLLFLEDTVAMEQLAPSSCHGCDRSRCPNWSRFNRRRR